MASEWLPRLVAVIFYNLSMLLMSLVVCALVSCRYYRKPKNSQFMDENDPRAKSLYNIKTTIAFPKHVPEENYRCFREEVNAISWSQEYENGPAERDDGASSITANPETSVHTENYLMLKQRTHTSETLDSSSPDRRSPLQLHSPSSGLSPLRLLSQSPTGAEAITPGLRKKRKSMDEVRKPSMSSPVVQKQRC